MNLIYSHFRNSEKYQGELYASTNVNTTLHKVRLNDLNSKSNIYNALFQISSLNRFYNKNRNFIELDPGILIDNSQSKYHYESTPAQDNSDNHFTANFSLPISVGHGRIEPIEDVRLAIYIIEELNKTGSINNLPQENVILEMAKEISKIKRQRFFDSRLRKIRELQVIDSFLIANKVISSNDIKYYTVLNDQWDYASGPVRSSGLAVNAGIDDRILINRYRRSETSNGASPVESELFSNLYNIAGFVQARYYKPINLYWQTSASLKTSYGIEIHENPLDKSNLLLNYRDNVFSTFLDYSIQFLPNSRTSAELYLSGIYKNYIGDRSGPDPDPITFQRKDGLLTFQTGFNMYYYISPKVRLNLNTDLSYTNQKVANTNDTQSDIERIDRSLYHNFLLTLTYSFF